MCILHVNNDDIGVGSILPKVTKPSDFLLSDLTMKTTNLGCQTSHMSTMHIHMLHGKKS